MAVYLYLFVHLKPFLPKMTGHNGILFPIILSNQFKKLH